MRAALLILLLTLSLALQAATLRVDPQSGGGGRETTFRTLSQALRQLERGDHLVIAKGVYRETLDLRLATGLTEKAGASARKATRISAEEPGAVLIKGSDVVTGWEVLPDGVFLKRDWRAAVQQVFVDGAALAQIGGSVFGGYPERPDHPFATLHASQGGIWPGRASGGLEALKPGSFYHDAGAGRLYLKLEAGSLTGRVVEVSVRPYLLIGSGLSDLEISGLRFEHASTTSVSQSGAISLAGDRLVLEGLSVSHVDGNGVDLSGDDNVVRASVASHCGMVGLKVRGHRARILDNEMAFNNTRGFNKWWEAGGAKFVGNGGLRDSEVARNRVHHNRGDGLWFDWQNRDNRIHHNVAAYNEGMGIHYEASRTARIEDNLAFANRQRGIYLPNGADSLIAHNLVVANGLEGIAIVDERRASAAARPELVPERNRVIGNLLAWNGKAALVLPVEAPGNLSDANLFLGESPPALSLGWGSREHPVLQGLAAWRSRTGQDAASRFEQLALPAALAAAFEAGELEPDFAPLGAYSERVRLPVELAALVDQGRSGSVAGPRR